MMWKGISGFKDANHSAIASIWSRSTKPGMNTTLAFMSSPAPTAAAKLSKIGCLGSPRVAEVDLLVPGLQADVGPVEIGQRQAVPVGMPQVGFHAQRVLAEVEHLRKFLGHGRLAAHEEQFVQGHRPQRRFSCDPRRETARGLG